MGKKKLTDWILVILFVFTAISGVKLHVVIDSTYIDHEPYIWAWFHSILAFCFIIALAVHVKQHWAWYKSLKKKAAKRELKVRRFAVLTTDTLYLLLLISGLVLIPMQLGTITTIGNIHFILGLIAILFSVGHIVKRIKMLK